jgi:hypothetical protein
MDADRLRHCTAIMIAERQFRNNHSLLIFRRGLFSIESAAAHIDVISDRRNQLSFETYLP